MDGRFTQREERLIEWLATPPPERDPDSMGELARQMGVPVETLRRWAARPDIAAEIGRRAGRALYIGLAEVLEALAAKAREGSFQHIKLYLELTGVYRKGGSDREPIPPLPNYLSALPERELRILANMESGDD